MAVVELEDRVLFGRDDAARHLGCSVRMLDLWISQGKIATTRLGRLVRVHRDELERIAREGIQ